MKTNGLCLGSGKARFAACFHDFNPRPGQPPRSDMKAIPMVRDYSQFLPPIAGEPSEQKMSPLQQLGWQAFFAQQIDADTLIKTPPARVVEVNRSGLYLRGEDLEITLPPRADTTVGDWFLIDQALPQNSVLLDRKSLVKRRAAGLERQVQLIAANIDTAFIVTSCNQDFNVARLERYLALTFEAGIAPVIVLTKSDLSSETADYIARASAISDRVDVLALDARGPEPAKKLAPWCGAGQTVAFLGSSGVGKSTLANALAGSQVMETGAVRADDAKGRHTTTRRQLLCLPNGCSILDTPGMRELQLTDTADGVSAVFADLSELAQQCRFSDCVHETEPGCAILEAVAAGDLDAARVARWRKLLAEDAFNTLSLSERRKKDKDFGKLVRSAVKSKAKRR